jgi:phospholipid-binding lipoprotein MlaA
MERVAITPVAEADPWERTNRRLYTTNRAVDRAVLRPVAQGYRAIVPTAARRGISTAFDTLGEPNNAVNAIAQGKIKRAFRALDRILVNGILGLGLADHASAMGLEEQPHDFGQTLAVWGVPSGPFVMLPLFGPSTARDAVGTVMDFFVLDPVDYGERRLLGTGEQISILAGRVIDQRAILAEQGEQLLLGAADEYAVLRSGWLQRRRYELFDGMPPMADEDDLTTEAPAPLPSPAPVPDSAPAPATPAAAGPAPAPPPS